MPNWRETFWASFQKSGDILGNALIKVETLRPISRHISSLDVLVGCMKTKIPKLKHPAKRKQGEMLGLLPHVVIRHFGSHLSSNPVMFISIKN
jgi:hypothetical protein